jgi:hypothetical protein
MVLLNGQKAAHFLDNFKNPVVVTVANLALLPWAGHQHRGLFWCGIVIIPIRLIARTFNTFTPNHFIQNGKLQECSLVLFILLKLNNCEKSI